MSKIHQYLCSMHLKNFILIRINFNLKNRSKKKKCSSSGARRAEVENGRSSWPSIVLRVARNFFLFSKERNTTTRMKPFLMAFFNSLFSLFRYHDVNRFRPHTPIGGIYSAHIRVLHHTPPAENVNYSE